MKLLWISRHPSNNNTLFFGTSTILIHPSPFFTFWSLQWYNSYIKILPNLHHVVTRTFQGHPQHHNLPRCTHCLKISPACHHVVWHMDNAWTRSLQKGILVSLVMRRICKNSYMVFESYIYNTLPLLSTSHKFSVKIFPFPERIFPQTSSLSMLSPKSWPDKVYPIFQAPSTPIIFIFSVYVVI